MGSKDLKDYVGINIEVPKKIHVRAKINATKKGMKLKDYIIYCIKQANDRYDAYRKRKGWK